MRSPGRFTVAFLICASATIVAQRHPMLVGLGLIYSQVAVEHATRGVLTDLTRGDFQLRADGVGRPIVFFSAADQPLTMVLLIDNSSSMTSRVPVGVLRTIFYQTFLPGLKPGDRMRVSGVAGRSGLSSTFTGDRRVLIETINAALSIPDAERFGPSPIWDAVDSAITSLAGEPGRRVILLLTDGRSTGNHSSFSDVVGRAMAEGIMVNIVGKDTQEVVFQERGGMVVRGDAEVALKALTDLTGGLFRSDNRVRVVSARSPDGSVLPDRSPDSNFGRLLSRVMTELHQLYTIGFIPVTRDGKTHTLDVQALPPDLTVRARRAFIAR